ncbi:1978_t:CDS:1, partial [Cetraspora pellucida]
KNIYLEENSKKTWYTLKMEYPPDPHYEEINNTVLILCNNLINNTYDPSEFKDQMKF